MRPILTAAQMRERDRRAIDQRSIPSLILMENAARGAAEILASALGSLEGRRIVILCGKGNNGGDGLAIARHAAILGADPVCALLHPEAEYTGDPGTQLTILRDSRLAEILPWEEIDREEPFDAVVDAMLGTGATGELRPPYREAVVWGSALEALRLAVDIPTGIEADTGRRRGDAFIADLTVTMGALKPGLLLGAGAEASGDIHVAHIGAPPEIYHDATIELLDARRALDALPEVRRGWNKYDRGKVLLLCGSRGMSGAGVMSAESALSFGAGLVVLGLPEAAFPIPQRIMPEIMTRHLPSGNDGAFAGTALDMLREELANYAAIAAGPGLSRSTGAGAMIADLLAAARVPVILDADGLTPFAGHPERIASRSCELVITPHHGEMARLLGTDRGKIGEDPLGIARQAAERTGAIVVLKGAPTVIATRDGRAWINGAGNPGMATGGTGDVLTGAIASLVGQRGDVLEGTLAAVFLHSFAGDIAAERMTERGLRATDIIEAAPEAYRRLFAEEE